MSRKRSKRYLENKKKVSEIKSTSLNDAIKAFKSNKGVKFDETLDVSIMLNKEKNKGEGLSRGYVQLPNGTGKKIKIAVFASSDKVKEAKLKKKEPQMKQMQAKLARDSLKPTLIFLAPLMFVWILLLPRIIGNDWFTIPAASSPISMNILLFSTAAVELSNGTIIPLSLIHI